MDSVYTEDNDMTFISYEEHRPQDHVDRAARNLREQLRHNESLRQQIQAIKNNPKTFLKPIRDELTNNINQLREENESLKRAVDKARAPSYTQMTKKKMMPTPKHENSSYNNSLRSSFRNPLGELDGNSHYDKADGRSTCLGETVARPRGELMAGGEHLAESEAMAQEIRVMLARAGVAEEQLARIQRKEAREHQSGADSEELARIAEYKKKLVRLLSHLRQRQQGMSQMTHSYQRMHSDTLAQLQQATATLEALQSTQIPADIEQQYAEVTELQDRLEAINRQLEELDQDKWLNEIARQLEEAVRRMGLPIPKHDNLRSLIDQLCGILIECHITSRRDGQSKLALLKQYHEEEKKNHNQQILALKNKEQTLGKQLIQLQMHQQQ